MEYRTPPYPVRVTFVTVGDWITYGVSGALDCRIFIKPNEPAHFPFTQLTETGFGGVLLVGDVQGNPRAFDISCPVENKRDVRIYVDRARSVGVCPVCGSEYAVFEMGNPVKGEAAEKGWYLRPYNVVVSGSPTEYAVIRN